MGAIKLFTLAQAYSILIENALDTGIFEEVRLAVLNGGKSRLKHDVEEEFSRFVSVLGLDGWFSWADSTLSLTDIDSQTVISMSKPNTGNLSLKAYIATRAFLCWLSTIIKVERGERPTLLVYESGDTFSFSWKLSRDQTGALLQVKQDPKAEQRLSSNFRQFTRLATSSFTFLEMNIYNQAGEAVARFNPEEGVITLKESKLVDGIVILAYYCWIVDNLRE